MTVSSWMDLPSSAFEQGELADHIAVVPLGATEQHGPHLPVGTDSFIGDGLVGAVKRLLPDSAKVVFLPTVEITNSVEHTNRPGTLSLGRDLTLAVLMEMARGLDRAGLRKMVFINAHGGNVGVMVDASHAIRAELGMLCVATNWMRLGLPDGLISEEQRAVDIHGGFIETSLMQSLHPDLVELGEAEDFPSLQDELSQSYDLLRAYGPIGFGWMGDDLNSSGAVGQSNKANAQQGEAIIAHQAKRMVQLLDEIQRFTPPWFGESEPS